MPRRPRSLSAVTVTATAFVAGTARGIRPAHAFTVPQPQESTVKAGRRRHKSGSDASSVASLRAVWRSLEGVTGDDVTGDDGRTSIYEVGSGESFALRLERQRQLNSLDDSPIVEVDADANASEQLHKRRVFLNAMLTSTVVAGAATFGAASPASAYERVFPADLDFSGGDSTRDLATLRGERIAAKKAATKKSKGTLGGKDVAGSAIWAGALWLLSGSRSNPLITPLANVLYDEKEEDWLKDRNDGLFAPVPPAFLALVATVFLLLGVAADQFLLLLAEGDKQIVLELAGVSLIGGGWLELGRIANGDKEQTRQDSDREAMLEDEFSAFADRRLLAKKTGNVHRSEIVSAFRRFNPKYRVDNEQYPLTDLEIERMARSWAKARGLEGMSAVGYFKGVIINQQADAFR